MEYPSLPSATHPFLSLHVGLQT